MAFIIRIRNRRGDVLAELVTVHDRYVLPDGSQMFIPARAVWCPGCGRFTLAEGVGTAADFDREFEMVRRSLRDRFSVDAGGEFVVPGPREMLAEWQALRESIRNRQSPPRCLECGGTDFTPLGNEGRWVSHPLLPEPVCATCTTHASMRRAGRLYSTEGLRLDGHACG